MSPNFLSSIWFIILTFTNVTNNFYFLSSLKIISKLSFDLATITLLYQRVKSYFMNERFECFDMGGIVLQNSSGKWKLFFFYISLPDFFSRCVLEEFPFENFFSLLAHADAEIHAV